MQPSLSQGEVWRGTPGCVYLWCVCGTVVSACLFCARDCARSLLLVHCSSIVRVCSADEVVEPVFSPRRSWDHASQDRPSVCRFASFSGKSAFAATSHTETASVARGVKSARAVDPEGPPIRSSDEHARATLQPSRRHPPLPRNQPRVWRYRKHQASCEALSEPRALHKAFDPASTSRKKSLRSPLQIKEEEHPAVQNI